MSSWRPEPGRRASRWLSRELAELFGDPEFSRDAPDAQAPAFDVLIVGSGYGGAVAAAELAGCTDADGRPLSVCVLERGREYLPGAFPSRLAELPTHVRGRFAGRRFGGEGLFDLRTDGDLGVVVANGLGGGSLINAGVMEIPKAQVFDERWPVALRGPKEHDPWFLEARARLGAASGAVLNTIRLHAAHEDERPAKARVLRQLAPGAFRDAAVTIAMTGKRTQAGVALAPCKRCGDCATGCNHGAKESLDTNLLVEAQRRGARIYCGATVLRVQRPPGCDDRWSVLVAHTDPKMRRRETGPRWIGARRLILAAGSLGSTEILLRSQREAPALAFSPRLGQGFSGNGDTIVFGYGYGEHARANAVADEDEPPGARGIGPTITGIVDARIDDTPLHNPSIVIEEMAVPGALRRAAEEVITTADTLHALGECDGTPHAHGHPPGDPYAVHRQRIRDMSIFAAMGDDGAAGTLRLGACARGDMLDGGVDIVWRGARELPLLDAQLRLIATRARAAGFAGRTLPNPLWRFLPEPMAALIGDGRGAPVSVHPLGGCAMGTTVADGVVDELGRVFDPRGDAGQPFHEGLLVLDGAIVPCALATNPALTIAALALRSVRTLRDRHWRWHRAPAAAPPALERPRVADTGTAVAAPAADGTVVGVTERLGGAVKLADASGVVRDCWVELTLTYDPLRLTDLFTPDPGDGRLSRARLSIGATPRSSGRLRIFLRADWEQLRLQPLAPADRERAEARIARSYALTGTLTLLQREASGRWRRTLRALGAWLRNRGLRDLVQSGLERLGKWWRDEPRKAMSWNDWLLGPLRLASRAGEVRRFDYALRIGAEQPPSEAAPRRFDAPAALVGGAIAGRKRITYARPSNPWRQLQELELTELAGRLQRRGPRVLALDPQYLAERGHPLLRIEAQRDHVEALADLASLSACVLRMLLSIHLWNARKPDAPRQRLVQRLPGIVPGLLEPQIHWIDVDRLGDAAVRIRLARYRTRTAPAPSPQRPAVLLIHGYSASGTTFAHPRLRPGLAQHLARAGREVWIADLRSSAGLPTATQPWSFEQIALADVPAAVDYVWRRSGEHRIDVLAHCMGATMLSMAVLAAGKTPAQIAELLARDGEESVADPFRTERDALPRRIRRAVLSQNGPAMVMSQQNIFRAYVMSYFEHVFGPLPYAFRPEPGQGLAAGLLDRFLSSLPYPDEELRLENPWQPWRRTEYLATRHRMDALYGRTFSLKQLSRRVLDHIDDFFGPLSLRTVAQVIHFSQLRTITSRGGRNRFVTPAALRACWTFPTLSLHGADNGLADLATAYRVQALLHGAGRHCEVVPLPGQGHQDCLIGVRARETFDEVLSFFERADDDPRFAPPAPAEACVAQAPWLGPLLVCDAAKTVHAGLGACPRLGRPIALRVLPVERVDGAWRHERLVQALGLVEADLRLALPADTDWFSVTLPAWSRSLRQLALLLVYAQPLSSDGASAPTVQGAVELALRAAAGDAAAGIVELGWTRADQPLRLALGSCQYPAGLFNEEPAHAAWRQLNVRLDRGEGPHYLVLTGDQIYADATAGLFDPTQRDDRYRKPYEAWLRNAQLRDALRRTGVLTTLDDHEIDDNWEPLPGRPGEAAFDANERLRRDGVTYFRRFQRPADRGGPLWLQHEAAGVHLFVLDTRTQRAPRSAAAPAASMIDAAQWQALEAWLCDPARRDAPKLVVSPAALLPRHRDAVRARLAQGAQDGGDHACLRSDGWDGYPQTLYRLLALIADRALRRVVFVSGDEHLGLYVRARIRGPRTPRGDKGVVVHSIHTPGLNTPYAFANARSADFVLRERFRFGQAERLDYACALRTSTYPGSGFVLLTIGRSGGDWQLRCEFPAGAIAVPL